MQHVQAHETDEYTMWLLLSNKFVHMNDKFVASLPFNLTNKDASVFHYCDSMLLICENANLCHLCEMNEFYNIVNHYEISLMVSFKEPRFYKIYDGKIIDETAFIVCSEGVLRVPIYEDERAALTDEKSTLNFSVTLSTMFEDKVLTWHDGVFSVICLTQFQVLRKIEVAGLSNLR